MLNLKRMLVYLQTWPSTSLRTCIPQVSRCGFQKSSFRTNTETGLSIIESKHLRLAFLNALIGYK